MPYVPPHTITVGETVTVATMNDEWGGNVTFLANPPACRVFHGGNTPIANGVWTAHPFNSELFDTNGMHSTVSNTDRITIQTAGLYLVSGGVCFGANGTGLRLCGISKNTVVSPSEGWHMTLASAAVGNHVHYTSVVKCAVADILRLLVFQNSGGSLDTYTEDGQPQFSAVWIGLG